MTTIAPRNVLARLIRERARGTASAGPNLRRRPLRSGAQPTTNHQPARGPVVRAGQPRPSVHSGGVPTHTPNRQTPPRRPPVRGISFPSPHPATDLPSGSHPIPSSDAPPSAPSASREPSCAHVLPGGPRSVRGASAPSSTVGATRAPVQERPWPPRTPAWPHALQTRNEARAATESWRRLSVERAIAGPSPETPLCSLPTVAGVLVRTCRSRACRGRGLGRALPTPRSSATRQPSGSSRGHRTSTRPPSPADKRGQGRGPSPASQHLAPNVDHQPHRATTTLASRRGTRPGSQRVLVPASSPACRGLRSPTRVLVSDHGSALRRRLVQEQPWPRTFWRPHALPRPRVQERRTESCSSTLAPASADNPSGDSEPRFESTRSSSTFPKNVLVPVISGAEGTRAPDRAFPTGHSIRPPTIRDVPCHGARALPSWRGRQASDRGHAVLGPTPGSKPRRQVPDASGGADGSVSAAAAPTHSSTGGSGRQPPGAGDAAPRGPGQAAELPTDHSHGGDGPEPVTSNTGHQQRGTSRSGTSRNKEHK
jgi:hypothetical protein